MNELFFVDKYGQRRRAKVIVCAFCQNEFLGRLNGETKFCSDKCAQASKVNKVEIQCAWCKSSFRRKPSKTKGSKSGLLFCNRECKDNAQKLGGLKEIMPDHFGTGKEHNYKSLIEEVENPICCGCGESRKYLLCVHHIDGERTNDAEENLEIVCGNCHHLRHLRFDKESNSWIYCTKYLTPRDKLKEV